MKVRIPSPLAPLSDEELYGGRRLAKANPKFPRGCIQFSCIQPVPSSIEDIFALQQKASHYFEKYLGGGKKFTLTVDGTLCENSKEHRDATILCIDMRNATNVRSLAQLAFLDGKSTSHVRQIKTPSAKNLWELCLEVDPEDEGGIFQHLIEFKNGKLYFPIMRGIYEGRIPRPVKPHTPYIPRNVRIFMRAGYASDKGKDGARNSR